MLLVLVGTGRMDRQYIQLDRYILECDQMFDILQTFHMFLDKDLHICNQHKTMLVHNRYLLHTLFYILCCYHTDLLGILANKYKLQHHFFLDTLR